MGGNNLRDGRRVADNSRDEIRERKLKDWKDINDIKRKIRESLIENFVMNWR
jgi:hypothetical protein